MQSTEKPAIRVGLLLGKVLTLGALIITISGCVADPYPPPRHNYQSDGYRNYDADGYSIYSGDYDEFNEHRDANEKNGWGHSDDRNFHNRDDYNSYDR